MRAEPLNIDWREEFRAFQAMRSRSRSRGRHLSEIVARIIKKIDPNRYGSGPMDPVLAQQGFIWEDVLSYAFARQFGFAQQTEVEKDGIIGTLDGHRLRTATGQRVNRVWEAKSTKISAANAITSSKFQPWTLRTSGYCTMLDTDEAEIIALFLNGGYELGGGRFGAPVAKGWLVRWSKRERQEDWDWILRERDEMDREERDE